MHRQQPCKQGGSNRCRETRSKPAFPLTVEPKQIGILTFSDEFHQTSGSIKELVGAFNIRFVDGHDRGKIGGPFSLSEIAVATCADHVNAFEVGFVHANFELDGEVLSTFAADAAIQDSLTAIDRLKDAPPTNVPF